MLLRTGDSRLPSRSFGDHSDGMRGRMRGGSGIKMRDAMRTPAILFPRRSRFRESSPGFRIFFLSAPSHPEGQWRGRFPVLQASPVTVAGPLRNLTAFRVSRNGQLTIVIPPVGGAVNARAARLIFPSGWGTFWAGI